MLQKLTRVSLIALAAAVLPAGLDAQQKSAARPTAQPSAGAPTLTAAQREMQGWYQELQQIGARLQAAQVKALQDPKLRASQEALARDFRALVQKQDPGLVGVEERAKAMEAEARRAQTSRDQAKMMKLAEEARQIELRVLNAQKKVLQQPAFAARAKAFEEQMRKKMLQVEPQTMALIQRGNLLQKKLQQAMQAQSARKP